MNKTQILIAAEKTGDLSNRDLSGIKLSETDLIGVNFSNSILKNADLQNSQFIRCYLIAADFKSANLEGVVFENNFELRVKK